MIDPVYPTWNSLQANAQIVHACSLLRNILSKQICFPSLFGAARKPMTCFEAGESSNLPIPAPSKIMKSDLLNQEKSLTYNKPDAFFV
jgi:hypothetical protein